MGHVRTAGRGPLLLRAMAPAPGVARRARHGGAARARVRALWTGWRTKAKDAPPPARERKRPHPSPGSRLDALMRHPQLLDAPCVPRLPIVLCHGLYGFDVRGPFLGLEYQYWSATLDVLRKKIGATVLVHGVPPTGSIEERAESLHRFLCSHPDARGQRLNFVAHSMGGLDARYLFSHIRPTEYTPASLTTLGTPHRGSPFMDWCNSNIGVGLDLIDSMMDSVQPNTVPDDTPARRAPYSLKAPLLARKETPQTSRQRHALSSLMRALQSVSSSVSNYILSVLDQPAYAMLSTRYMTRLFNPTTPNRPGIHYYSIAARARDMSVLHPLWLPKLILDKAATTGSCGADTDGSHDARGTAEGGNDGLVSVRSAQWGEFLGVMENWDHWDIRGPGGPHRLRVTEETSQAWSLSRLWSTLRDAWSGQRAAPAPAPPERAWDWHEAALSEYDERSQASPSETPLPPAVYALRTLYEKQLDSSEEAGMAERLARWISSHLPTDGAAPDGRASEARADAPRERDSDTSMLLEYLTAKRAPSSLSDDGAEAPDDRGTAGAQAPSTETPKLLTRAERLSTAFIELFPYMLYASQEAMAPKDDTFERFWAAVCRHLHEEGL